MHAITFSAVTKSYDSRPVLQDINLAFETGKLTAIIGRSGCGKSTLLKLCNGLTQPDSGSIEVFGESLNYLALPTLRRRMGYAVQGTGLFPHLNTRDNIALPAVAAGWSPDSISPRIDELLSLTQLSTDLLNAYPHQLSGGQQQRAGLCRAMLLRPEVLLLDEPFAAIDPITRFDIHQQLQDLLRNEPTTVVLVTHDMREAMLLADHIVVMEAGRIALNESTQNLINTKPGLEPEALLKSIMSETQR
ncbi:ATP-binding cassette domain-containing protein [Halieaceae bacterium IMCC14734]|uniref:ATP-binding cassette domain-containing protein n=1 Tax=Candidatus Litorirhabdus singularis TaxID=2518993 RepID=A0ABT3TDV0_9GAMM|nr:ATP-binding cassette domain-containing protein [Candidatus Litorirhabdus singularis]MCX2980482.1 ATP-binding cassette domain-containing protein [Candidatus Litorirhabdus singularis]